MAWFAWYQAAARLWSVANDLRFADREFPLEEVAQEGVVAVRPAVVVDQQRRACKLPQDFGRPVPIRHDIAQRRGQIVEDRRPGQERDLGRGAALEHLGSQIVVDEMFGADVDAISSFPRRPGSEHRERQQSGPSFGFSRQAGRRVGRQSQPEFASQPDGLTLVHRQLRGTDLDERTLGGPAGEREAHPGASRDGHCDPSGRCSTSSARMSRHALEVIRCPSSMAIRTRSGGRDIASSNRPTTVRCDSVSAAIELKSSGPSGTRRSIAAARSVEEHHRVAITVVGRQPGHRPLILRSPTGQEGSTCRNREGRRTRRQVDRGLSGAGAAASSGATFPHVGAAGRAWPRGADRADRRCPRRR